MEWYQIALIGLGCVNIIQVIIFFHLRAQKDITDERHKNIARRLDRVEEYFEDLNRWSFEVDAYLRFESNKRGD